jgi:endonuclease G
LYWILFSLSIFKPVWNVFVKNKLFYNIIPFVFIINAFAGPPAQDRERFLPGLPLSSYSCEKIFHTGFTLGYDAYFKQARWVVYGLTAEETLGQAERTNDFRPDPDISGVSPQPEDYSNSGFDRGHLAPAADFKWSEQAMSETFVMSNMSPQRPGFNRGVWKQLEEQVRRWASENEMIYVVSGPVLTDNLETIGNNRVAVPQQYFKALLDNTEPGINAIGFVLDNDASLLPLTAFAVTIDSVERITGLNLFSELPDAIEDKLESIVDTNMWFANYQQQAKRRNYSKANTIKKTVTIDNRQCSRQCPAARRTGSLCVDGTYSKATGRGACSGHGGVKCWECLEQP